MLSKLTEHALSSNDVKLADWKAYCRAAFRINAAVDSTLLETDAKRKRKFRKTKQCHKKKKKKTSNECREDRV